MDKFLFLDVDGVLNHEEWYTKITKEPYLSDLKGYFRDFDPECVKNINKVLSETGAKLVISSSWRFDTRIKEIFRNVGLTDDLMATPPILSSSFRGDEISKFFSDRNLDESKSVYVIIDDDDDFTRKQKKHFVHTSWIHGFTVKDAEKAIKLLNSK